MRQAELWMAAYVVNALWQAPLVFLLAFASARALRRAGPVAEHRVWVMALLLEVALPLVSAFPAMPVERLVASWMRGTASGQGRVSVTMGGFRVAEALRSHGRWDAVVAGVLGTTVLYAACRLVWRYRQTRRLVAGAHAVAWHGEVAELWALCCERFELRQARVAESAEIAGPLTCGIWRRWLLLPAGFTEGLGEAELRVVFAHECAHMRRRDFGKNLLYEALTLPVAWHPAVWATRSRMVESREWVCDVLAAGTAEGQGMYARSLLQLASLLVKAGPVRQFHAIGIFDANRLEERIMRLTQEQGQMSWMGRVATMAACGVLAAGVCVPTWAWGTHAVTPQETASSASGGGHVLQVQSAVMAGQVLSQVHPVYPPDAKAAGTQGSVVLDAVIGTDGSLSALKLVSGPPELARAAWTAVTQWTWKPYLLNGEPTPVETTITVNFQLEQ